MRPLVIQSLFMRDRRPERHRRAEWRAYCDRLNEIIAAGGQLKLIQIYTIARHPAEVVCVAADRRGSGSIIAATSSGRRHRPAMSSGSTKSGRSHVGDSSRAAAC